MSRSHFSPRILMALAVSVALVCFGVPAASQAQKPDEPRKLAARVELVNVEVTVTDARGNFVGNLKRENFRILDEGVEQPITHFAAVEAPAIVLVLVETSPAVYLIHRQHLLAAHALLDGLAADDWVMLAGYDREARAILSFTQDKRSLQRALLGLHYNLGMTELNLFGSLGAALDWLAPVAGRKAVVLLGTGLDTSQRGRWDEFTGKLRASDAVVYAVALGGELRQFKKKGSEDKPGEEQSQLSFELADHQLKTIAEVTGGQAYFPKKVEDFEVIYRQIATTLRHQYSLGFAPPVRDGRYHHIEVRLLDGRGRVIAPAEGKTSHRVRARPGYLAPEP